jgi:hypothetical protein
MKKLENCGLCGCATTKEDSVEAPRLGRIHLKCYDESLERNKPNFEKELQHLLNRFSKENGSNTPDFILAEYLNNCLITYNKALQKREKWYGRDGFLQTPEGVSNPASPEPIENNLKVGDK